MAKSEVLKCLNCGKKYSKSSILEYFGLQSCEASHSLIYFESMECPVCKLQNELR